MTLDSNTEKLGTGTVGTHVGEIVGKPDKKGNPDREAYFYESLIEDLSSLTHEEVAKKWSHRFASLESQRYEDPSTGLKVKEAGKKILQHEIDIARAGGGNLALLMIDLDGFKQINDNLGHAAGDEAILILANYLENNTSRETVACRFGGDEFFLIMPGSSAEAALGLSRRVIRELPQKMNVSGFNTTPSIGIAVLGDERDNSESLMGRADEGIYIVKGRGGNDAELVEQLAA